jgi:hypothetical protein
LRNGRVKWRRLKKRKLDMPTRMEGWKRLMEKAKEEEGRDDP